MKLKKWLLLFLCTVFVLTGFLSVSRAEAETKTLNGRFAQTEARAMLSRINDYRTGGSWYWNKDNTTKITVPAGTLSTLSFDYGLEQIAMQRAAEIVELFDHQRPNGEWCFTCTYNKEKNIIETYMEGENVGPNIVRTWGENIAAGYPSEESVFVAWREDDEDYAGQGHRRNMLEPRWNAVGIACFVYNNRKYWVQEFGEANSNTAYAAPNDSSATVEVEVSGGSDSTPTVTATPTPEPVPVNSASLSFETTTLDGKPYSSAAMKNYDLVMINFWGEWCGPCVSELPHLQQISENYKNVLILGAWYGNSKDQALTVAKEAGVTYPLIYPADMLNDYLWASNSFPHTFFFDSNGNQLGDIEIGSRDYSGWEYKVQERLSMLAQSGGPQPVATPTPTPTATPTPAPLGSMPLSFDTTTLDGKAYSSAAMKNYDLVVVNFWGEWCNPCLWELPYLQQISENYKNVLILGAWDGDSEAEALAAAKDAGVTYPLVYPTGMLESYLLASNSFPHTFFFDSNGNQVGDIDIGAKDYSSWESTIQERLAMLSQGGAAQPTATPTPTATPAPVEASATVKRVQAKKSLKLQAPKVKGNAYQWYVRTSKNAPWQSLGKKGAKDKLSVKATMAMDGYQYRCEIRSASGVRYTDTYELYVYEQLKVKKQPKWGKKVLPGAKMTLTITAQGASSYQWVTRPNGSSPWTKIEGATGTSYVVDVQEGMAGRQYACQISGKAGTAQSKAAVVKIAPWPKVKFSKQPVLKKPVVPGSWVTLTVKAQNADTYQWYYRTSAKGAWILYSGATQPNLTFQVGAGTNGYQYKCTAKGRGGTVESKPVTLKVVTP